MEAKPYPEDKRRDIIKKNKEDFVAFLEEVTEPAGRQFIQQELLPIKVKGFRPGHAQPTLTVPRLINNLKREQELTNSNSAIWNKFKNAWTVWIKSRRELDELLLKFDNTSDFDENHKCIIPPNSELDIQCFKTLLEASRNNQIDQETIRRFYEYGYFLPSNEIEVLIAEAVPRAEIERQQQLAALPDRVDRLSEAINSLNLRLSEIASTDETAQKLARQIAEVTKSFESQLSEIKLSFNKRIGQSINSRLSKVEESVKSLETQLSAAEFINDMEQKIAQLDQRLQKHVESFEAQLDGINKAIVQIKTAQEEQHQTTDAPRIAYQAVQIGERYAINFREEKEHYNDENDDYLEFFRFCLRKFGVTNSNEMANAIHVALKAFPVLEVADTRIIKIWRLMCGGHLHVTQIDVEMGWLGLQDWFPGLFAQECFGEQLRRMDLDDSIRKMLEKGNMPWAIYFSNCDRSFPESYLPRFLDWIGDFSEGGIRVFLTRCSGVNHCETNPDIYARVACLPKPQEPEPIEARNLRPLDVITRSEWESWCSLNPDTKPLSKRSPEFLNRLQLEIENVGVQIPRELLQEIQHYLRLSHGILAASKALDWALTLRLLPWLGNRRELIEIVQNLINQENSELLHFRERLVQASEEDE